MNDHLSLLDPTSERAPRRRPRRPPPGSLEGVSVAMLDIGKARGDVFIDQLGRELVARGITVKHYAKPTNTKIAPTELKQQIAAECAVVIEALSD